jgi:tartrate-resistant acid phosphatase type 5
VGHHGPTDILVEKLNPMLLKYKVATYFSGHDHDMQHLNDSGVQYFLSGAGHLVESSQKHKVGENFF